MTLYQDQLAHAADIRAVMRWNMYTFNNGRADSLMIVEREGSRLWLAYTGEDRGGVVACMEFLARDEDGPWKLHMIPSDSLSVPFRDSIRSHFEWFITMERPHHAFVNDLCELCGGKDWMGGHCRGYIKLC